jgi:Bacteriophage clamp loader A subunit
VEAVIDGFLYLNDITVKKENLIAINPEAEEDYPAVFINKGLSQFKDTLFAANEMNVNWLSLDKKMQFDYLFHTVRKSNRFAKWAKGKEEPDLELIQTYFKCSPSKAKEYLKVLNKTQLDEIREKFTKGGLNNKKGK